MNLLTKLLPKKKKTKIEFCEKNLDRFITEELMPAYQSFLNQSQIDYMEYQCQSKCEICKKTPYAMVNGEMVTADNADELLANLKQKVNRKK